MSGLVNPSAHEDSLQLVHLLLSLIHDQVDRPIGIDHVENNLVEHTGILGPVGFSRQFARMFMEV